MDTETLLKGCGVLAAGAVLHVMAQPKNPAKNRKGSQYTGKVCVLGAGVAGLQVARSLKARGIECVVFDKAPDVGGLWSTFVFRRRRGARPKWSTKLLMHLKISSVLAKSP